MLKRVGAGIGVNLFDKLIVAGAQLVVVPVLAHAWGLRLYGLWVLLSTIPTFLAMGDLGFATAAGTKMTIANARGERDVVIRIFQSAWGALLISSSVFILVALAAAMLVPLSLFGADPGLAEGDLRQTLLFLLLYGIAVVQGTIFFAGFRAAGLYATGAFWNALIIMIETGALIVAVALGARMPMAAQALLCGRIVGLIGQNILLRAKVPWLSVGFAQASLAEMRALLAPAGSVMLLPLAQALLLQGTALALGAAAGQAAVPAFTATRTLSRVGQQLCWTVNSALMPEVSAAIGRRDRNGIAMMVMCTLAVSVLLVVPYALGFGALGQWVVQLWSGHVIVPHLSLVLAMALSVLLGGFWFPMSNLILAADRQSSYTMTYAVIAGLAVCVSYVLSRAMGGTGAAIAMALSDGVMLLVVTRLTFRHLASASEILAAGPRAFDYILSIRQKLKAKLS